MTAARRSSAGRGEASLAELLPVWKTIREDEVTALVTPSLGYVGALELTGVDVRLASPDVIATLGEQLRSVVASIDDGWTLHFLTRVSMDCDSDIRDFERATEPRSERPRPEALQAYVAARASWLRRQALRRVRQYLFFSRAGALGPKALLGARMCFADLRAHSVEAHRVELRALCAMRNALRARLEGAGLGVRELGVAEVQEVVHALLNPTHAEKRWPLPPVRGSCASLEASLLEYTEAEQLCAEDVVEERDALRQGCWWRRAMTLRHLPSRGTAFLSAEPLVELVEPDGDDVAAFPYWLSVAITVEAQARQRLRLNVEHNLVGLVAQAVPFLRGQSASSEAEGRSKLDGIEGLFSEMAALGSKVVSLSVGLLVDAPTREALDARTEAARAAFSRAGSCEVLLEEVTQLPALLSMLPGSGPYRHRARLCTSRNAADFIPAVAPWRGTVDAPSLLWTPRRDAFRFDFFDSQLPSHHGLVWADTGSGKSVTLGALTLDALAAGHDAILVDNGRSWQRFTELLGGIHVAVDLSTPITPFLPFRDVAAGADATRRVASGGSDGTAGAGVGAGGGAGGRRVPEAEGGGESAVDAEAVDEVVAFLELCVRDEDLKSFGHLQRRVVAAAVRRVYETRFRAAPDERPLMRHFREAIAAQGQSPGAHPDDVAIAENVARRLGLYVGDEQYGRLLDRPSTLRFDAPLVCFEMEAVARAGPLRSIAFATVMRAIAARAAATRRGGARRRTLVEVDEGHAWLGHDDAAERYLELCYRVMRKYGVAMWMVSQGLEDFQGVKAGRAILGNSAIKLLLYHASGHRAVGEYFGLTPRAVEAFTRLERRPGRFSDGLLLYGQRQSVVRLALHPLALWMLTTAPADLGLIASARRMNPALTELAMLRLLATRFPHGAHGPRAAKG